MTPYDPDRHHRRSIRLKGYDYTQPGAYFVTLCTHDRAHLFGEVVDGEMRLNDAGRIADQCWRDIPAHFPHVKLDAFVIMPNHVHGILWIVYDDVGAKNFSPLHRYPPSPLPPPPPSPLPPPPSSPLPPPPPSPLPPPPPSLPHGTSKTIGSVVRGFKIGVTKWFRQNTSVFTVWQRNYYEHIIRNEHALNAIRQYIDKNPLRWDLDRYNPDRIGNDPLAREIWDMFQNDDRQHPHGGSL